MDWRAGSYSKHAGVCRVIPGAPIHTKVLVSSASPDGGTSTEPTTTISTSRRTNGS